MHYHHHANTRFGNILYNYSIITEFLNLLSMKPVFDSDGVYSYVIGVQYVFTPDQKFHSRDIQLIDDLLYSLPNVLI